MTAATPLPEPERDLGEELGALAAIPPHEVRPEHLSKARKLVLWAQNEFVRACDWDETLANLPRPPGDSPNPHESSRLRVARLRVEHSRRVEDTIRLVLEARDRKAEFEQMVEVSRRNVQLGKLAATAAVISAVVTLVQTLSSCIGGF